MRYYQKNTLKVKVLEYQGAPKIEHRCPEQRRHDRSGPISGVKPEFRIIATLFQNLAMLDENFLEVTSFMIRNRIVA